MMSHKGNSLSLILGLRSEGLALFVVPHTVCVGQVKPCLPGRQALTHNVLASLKVRR
jgi:hypothetical protein